MKSGRQSVIAACLAVGIGGLTNSPGVQAEPVAPDCYQTLDLANFRPVPAREVILGVDETTVFPSELIDELVAKVRKTIQPGDRVTLIAFSANSRQHYLRVLTTTDLDQPPSATAQRQMPVRRVADLNHCITLQRTTKTKAMEEALRAALKRASNSIPYSEIVGAVRDISTRLQASPAPIKLLILGSDGLQHSPGLSFYEQKAIRVVDPARELAGLRAKGLLATLSGVRVFVFGGGLAPPDAGFRDQAELVALESFWREYIKESGGSLVAFGKPVPLVDFK